MPIRFSKEKREEWKRRIVEQQQSGLSINRWCEQNQFSPHAFHYWKKQFFPKQLIRSSFTELTDVTESGIFIEYRGVRICIERSFDPSVLKSCLIALRDITC